jgi:hypothetical protein
MVVITFLTQIVSFLQYIVVSFLPHCPYSLVNIRGDNYPDTGGYSVKVFSKICFLDSLKIIDVIYLIKSCNFFIELSINE